MKNIGIVLLAIGLMIMLILGLNFITIKEIAHGRVLEKGEPVQWPPLVGAAMLVSGIVILGLIRAKKHT
jgi:hypothetical protein